MKLKDKLNQTDADNVVSNTANNEAVKQVSKLPTSEQLALGEEVVDVEIANEVNKGSLAPEEAIKVKDDLRNNTNKTTGVSSQFKDALKFLIPQAVGAAVGGLAGGGRAAVKGAETGATIAKGLREEERARQASRLNNGPRISEDLVHADTGRPLLMNKTTGTVTDHNGNIVPQVKIKNLRSSRNDRLAKKDEVNAGFKETKIKQADQRLNNAAQNIELNKLKFANTVEEQGESDKLKLVDSFESDPEVRNIREADRMIGPARAALQSGSPMAPGIAANALARLNGEKGPLTESDLSRFGGRQDIASKLKRITERERSGTPLTPQDKEDFLFLLKVMEDLNTGRINKIKNRKVRTFSKATKDVSKAEGEDILDVKETPRQKLERLRKKRAGK